MSKQVTRNTETERYETKETITRFTTVTDENISRIAKKIFDSQLQCVSSLQCATLTQLENLLRTECIMYRIPLLYFLDGAFRKKPTENRATYFGPVAVQLYTHLATENNLPTVVSINLKYILDNLKMTIDLQDIFAKIQAVKKLKDCPYANAVSSIPFYKEVLENQAKYVLPAGQRFIVIPKEQIYGADQYAMNNNFLYCIAGAYNVVGAIGEMHLSDGSKFSYKYELDPGTTALITSKGTSAYSKNPLQFITTKFTRHAMKSYYATKIASMPKSSDDVETGDDSLDIIEASNFASDVEKREQLLVNQAESIALKIKEIDSRG